MLFRTINKKSVKLIALLLAVLMILSSLVSCRFFVYTADSEDEIRENIAESLESGGKSKDRVADYLRQWGLPVFDKVKFEYYEVCCNKLYNLDSGMPDTLSHAVSTAELFLANFYNVISLDDKTAVTDGLLSCYVYAIGDIYSVYRPPVETEEHNTDMSGKFGGIGVMVEYNDADQSIMINTVYPDSPAEDAGVKVGDFIYAVDGKTVEELGYTNAVSHVRGEIGTTVELTLLRGGELITLSMIRAEVQETNVEYSFDAVSKIGYVEIISFKENTFAQFKEAIDEIEAMGAVGIIFDLRDNPGGYVTSVCEVLSYLFPTGETIMSYQYKNRDAVYRYTEDDTDDNNNSYDHTLDLPMVVLCNQYTASAGEIFTAAVRDYSDEGKIDATIVGTVTYKKGIMQNSYSYIDNSSVTITVAYIITPSGDKYHGKGITPDVIVENNGTEDLQLEAAYSELEKLILSK